MAVSARQLRCACHVLLRRCSAHDANHGGLHAAFWLFSDEHVVVFLAERSGPLVCPLSSIARAVYNSWNIPPLPLIEFIATPLLRKSVGSIDPLGRSHDVAQVAMHSITCPWFIRCCHASPFRRCGHSWLWSRMSSRRSVTVETQRRFYTRRRDA